MDITSMMQALAAGTAGGGGAAAIPLGGYGGGAGGGGGQGGPRRRARGQEAEFVQRVHRGQRPVDLSSSIIAYLDRKRFQANNNPFTFHVPPHEYYCKDVLPPFATAFNPATALCTQWAHTSQYPDNRANQAGGQRRRGNFTNMKWNATGRKLLCTTANGEFVLYNGASFTCEMKTLAHRGDTAIRGLAWGARSGLVLSGDDAGTLKMWGQHFSLAAEVPSNQRAIRDVCFAPSELRFCTGGQDGTVAIWDVQKVGAGASVSASGATTGKNLQVGNVEEEQPAAGAANTGGVGDEGAARQPHTLAVEPDMKLSGHGGDVHSVRWHPYRCLVATGSQDKDVRLWDPRAGGASVATLQGHGESVNVVRWHDLGRETWLLTAAKDNTVRLWDTRMVRHELTMYSGHNRPVTCVEWHPTHPDLFVSAGADGLIAFWMVAPPGGEGTLRSNGVTYEVSRFAAGIDMAHDKHRNEPNSVQCLGWNPLGHILASASGEVHIWTRNRPGAMEELRFDADEAAAVAGGGAGGEGEQGGGEAGLGAVW